MASDPKFTHYRSMVSQLAAAGLAAAPNGHKPDSILLALPAARILLRDDPAHHEGLVRAMQHLANLGRPWLRIGVNVGTLGEPTGDAGMFALQQAVDRLMRQYARTAAAPGVEPPAGFPIALRDTEQHTRDIYHPFAAHLCLAAFGRCYETLAQPLWSACEQAMLELVAPLRFIEHFADAPPPPALVPLVLWQALAIAEQSTLLSRDIDLELVDVVVQVILSEAFADPAKPTFAGALHASAEHDTLDTWTYRELTALHALANLALLRRNPNWAKRVEQVATYHVQHTQPDNATNQPWSLFAFLWSSAPGCQSFADQQLHDLTAHAASTGSSTGLSAGTPNPLAAMLLADAADRLAAFG